MNSADNFRCDSQRSTFRAIVGTVVAGFICLWLSGEIGLAQNRKAAKLAANQSAGKQFEDFNPTNFSRPTPVDNEWMPLKPATRFVYDGSTVEDDGKLAPHRIVINVTDLTKTIGGIRSVVTWDLDYTNGELTEAELAFFAQDNDGNVWRMGEYPEEYQRGKFVAASPWLHGLQGARAGIEMKAKPLPGTPSYSQGWAPAVHWTDRGRVDQVGQRTSVPAGTFDDVLVIAETSQSEPDAEQLKYFARGIGNVRVDWRGGGEKSKETLQLTTIERLDEQALSEVRAAALKLEASGYKNSKNAYGQTRPAERMSVGEGKSTVKQ